MILENIMVINYGERVGATKWENGSLFGTHTQRNGNDKPMGGIFYVRYIHTYIHTYICTYICTHACTHAHVHACMHTWAHTHTPI